MVVLRLGEENFPVAAAATFTDLLQFLPPFLEIRSLETNGGIVGGSITTPFEVKGDLRDSKGLIFGFGRG